MTRDKGIAIDLAALATSTSQWENKLDELAAEAAGQGAFAHRNLYEEVAGSLTAARTALERAAQYMDPDQTSAEDFDD